MNRREDLRISPEQGAAVLALFLLLSGITLVLTLAASSLRHALSSSAELTQALQDEAGSETEFNGLLETAWEEPLRKNPARHLFLGGSGSSSSYLLAYRRTPHGVLLPDWAGLRHEATDSCVIWNKAGVSPDMPGLLSSRTCTHLSSSKSNKLSIGGNLELGSPLTIEAAQEAELVVFGSLRLKELNIGAVSGSRVIITVAGSIRVEEFNLNASSDAQILIHSSTGLIDLGTEATKSRICSSFYKRSSTGGLTIQSYSGWHTGEGIITGSWSCSARHLEVKAPELRLLGSLRSALHN